MKTTGLTGPTLRRLYSDLGKTDAEIAEFFGVDRTSIVHLRKRYGVNSRKTVGEIGEEMAMKELRSRGYDTENMNEKDKLHPFDLLVESYFRVEVKSSSLGDDGYFNFVLTEKEANQNIESNHRIRLASGRTKKLFRKTCDLIVMVGIEPIGDCHFFLIPPGNLPDKLGMVRVPLSPFARSKYNIYREKWNELEKIKKVQCYQHQTQNLSSL
ncbi:hypothetical protein AMS60_05490 [Bacillus sp. FJAT-21945]|nr:hypothetical protein AMS60_05490 [Bacillus sp. FJAT-21945]